jgi:hypothetical protein
MTPQESIAHYRIVSKLGEGGMGVVYRLNKEACFQNAVISRGRRRMRFRNGERLLPDPRGSWRRRWPSEVGLLVDKTPETMAAV